MEYQKLILLSDIKNEVKNKEIYIVGGGESSKSFKKQKGNIIISLNDSYDNADYTIVMDGKKRFDEKRWNNINAKSKKIITQLEQKQLELTDPSKIINFLLNNQVTGWYDLDKTNEIGIAYTSAFSAVQIAYQLGAKIIYLVGVDLNDHHLNKFSSQIKEAFKSIDLALKSKGIELINLSNISILKDTITTISKTNEIENN